MWKRKKKKDTLENVSVTKLLDDFVDLDVEDDSKRAGDMGDDEYIAMMVKKEAQRKLERSKKDPKPTEHDEMPSPLNESIEKIPPPKSEPQSETFELHCENDVSPEDEAVIEEVMSSQFIQDEPDLTERMKVAVDFLQDEVTTSVSKREARETLEKYRKDIPVTKKSASPIVSEKMAPVKSCQNCYFCIGERKLGGSCWCNCSNPGRSSHAVSKGSWVKSRLNLPCWKPTQE